MSSVADHSLQKFHRCFSACGNVFARKFCLGIWAESLSALDVLSLFHRIFTPEFPFPKIC
jgi:hypothetical protein